MSRGTLPEGVAPANNGAVSDERRTFSVPETSAPEFSKPAASPVFPDQTLPALRKASAAASKPMALKGKVFDRFVEDDDEDEDDARDDNLASAHVPHAPGPVIILIAIVLVLAALAAFVLVQNQQPTPDCADQPEWNQYNCRAG